MMGKGKGNGFQFSWSMVVSWGKSKNLRIFLLCFVVALVFWGLKSLNRDYQTNINLPIEVVYNDSTLIPLDPPPRQIPLRVSGYGWDLIRWTFGWKIDPLSIQPDGLPENQTLSYPIYSEEITGKLQDLKLLNYLNTEVPLNFDFLERKTVPIQFDSTTIPFRENFYLKSSPVVNPDSLTFLGPKSLLENLQDHYTLSLPFEGIDKDFQSSISVQFPHSELVSVYPEDINVSFPVGEWNRVEGEFVIKQDDEGVENAESLILSNTSVKILFRFPEGFDPVGQIDSVGVYILNSKVPADSILPVYILNLPQNIGGYQITPDSVRVLSNGINS